MMSFTILGGFFIAFIPFMTQTASMMSFTILGGFFIAFTILMSLGFKVLRAETEASSAGIASARSASHSDLIPCATAAALFATASSADTSSFFASTYCILCDLNHKFVSFSRRLNKFWLQSDQFL